MPGRDYTRAHALLQESLAGDVSYPSLHLINQRGQIQQLHKDAVFKRSRRSPSLSSLDQEEDECDGEVAAQRDTHLSPPIPTYARGGHGEVDPSFGLSRALQSSDQSTSTRPSTPFNIAVSVTPDTQLTPPSLGGIGESKSPFDLKYMSSHAESFMTAQEEQGSRSSLGGSRHLLPLYGIFDGERTSPGHSGLANRIPASLPHQSPRSPAFGHSLSPRNAAVDESTTTAMQNRPRSRRRLGGSQHVPNDLTFLDDTLESSIRLASEESPRSWFEASSSDSDVSAHGGRFTRTPDRPVSHDKEADYLNMTPPKRLPNSTKAAAIIEAEIRESPEATPRRHHRLRHYQKLDALRNGDQEQVHTAETETNTSPGARAKDVNAMRDEDVRARTRSSLVASLPAGLKPNSPLWRRTQSLRAVQSPRMTTSGAHSKRVSDTTSDGLEGPRSEVATPLDQVHGLYNGNESADNIAPLEFQHLHRRHSSDHLPADDAVDRQSGVFATRHALTQPSPFSEVSEGLILNDARAISIVPHNNNSLLVVHQHRSAHTSSDVSPAGSMPEAMPSRPFEQLRDPVRSDTHRIAATSVVPQVDSGGQVTRESRPELSRQDSLMKRAIRTFSSQRAGLLRRHTTKAHENQASSATYVPRQRLHPFWQPRGFWEGFSDTGEMLHTTTNSTLDGTTRGIGHDTPSHRSVGAVQTHSNPELPSHDRDADPAADRKRGLTRAALQRLASLKATARSIGAPKPEPSNSQRRRLRLGLKEKIQERTQRRQEQRRELERARIRESIGPRYYVDMTGISD